MTICVFSFLDDIAPQNGVNSQRKEFVPWGTNSFLSELILPGKGGTSETARVAHPELVSMHLTTRPWMHNF